MKPTIYIERALYDEPMALVQQHFTVVDSLQEAEGYIVPMGKIDEALLAANPKLKVVSNIAVGYDGFDLEAMHKHGVVGTHTPHVLDATVADLTVALILAVARKIPQMDEWLRAGHWQGGVADTYFGRDIHQKKLGIVGLGRIGEQIVKRLHNGFDMEVYYYNRSRHQEIEETYDATYLSLNALFATCDVVLTMVPLTAETTGMIGREQLDLLQAHAIFVNTARGLVVDEAALVQALQNKQFFGAGLDVFAQEPIGADHPLCQLDNVVLTPHIGSATVATRTAMQLQAVRNTIAVLKQQGEAYIVK